MDEIKKLLERINAKMDESGLTRYELAQKSGFTRATLKRYLDGETQIPADRLLIICKIVGVPYSFG